MKRRITCFVLGLWRQGKTLRHGVSDFLSWRPSDMRILFHSLCVMLDLSCCRLESPVVSCFSAETEIQSPLIMFLLFSQLNIKWGFF